LKASDISTESWP